MLETCLFHIWTDAVEIEPEEIPVILDGNTITDIITEERARELEAEGVLKVEDLPLFLNRGPARVWARNVEFVFNRKVRRWRRECRTCREVQVTDRVKDVPTPDFDVLDLGDSYA
jgi:hypothetical protein